jgi:hypothetical protein
MTWTYPVPRPSDPHSDALNRIADELRTANLLQFLMWEPSDNYACNAGSAELQEQIVARLGLNEATR